ncbi:A/G-specific adenine glycosylase [Lysobacteraceae bacterium NML03-0222]|nr:A/G-specific adenine glycosylase [Xanthomonadaceae bacterium NML03-0222]
MKQGHSAHICGVFAERLIAWFEQHGRHDLPWMQPRTPYRVWLSEIMLQQTQVTTVIPYFQRFVAALPDLPSLAEADSDQVLSLWSGLGYYSRARNLHTAAKQCVAQHGGQLPQDFDALLALPGIGPSTAGAILAQAWNAPYPILDGNVKRVLSRLHGVEGWPGLPAVEKHLWQLAWASLPATPERMADYTQAQMDLGATLCSRSRPHCLHCPFADICIAQNTGRTASLPAPRPKKALPARQTQMLWLRDTAGRSLLLRRPASGVWPSLWSLPEAADSEALIRTARQYARLADDATAIALPAIVHVFTHFRLQIQPFLLQALAPHPTVGDNDALRWASREELASLGIPAPVRKLIEQEPTA